MLSYVLVHKAKFGNDEVIHDRIVDRDRNLILADRWRSADGHNIKYYPDPTNDEDEVPAILEVFRTQGGKRE
jgi:hypothetical protein